MVFAASVPLPAVAASFTVSSEAELSQAITDAAASGDASSTITLSNGITITSPLPAVASNIRIDTGSHALTFSGSAIFNVAANATLTLSGEMINSNTTINNNGAGTMVLDVAGSGISRIGVNAGNLLITGGRDVTFGTNLGSTLAQLGVAVNANSTASLTISGTGTRLIATGSDPNDLSTAAGASSTLTIQDGGSYTSTTALRVHTPSSRGTSTINVLGNGSSLNVASLNAFNGTTNINVLDGGVINTTGGTSLGGLANTTYADANITTVVSGAGSQWNVGGTLALYKGSFSILNGGVVTAVTTNAATATGTAAPDVSLLVSGQGSELRTNALTVGTRGTGTLTISDNAQVVVNGGASALVLGSTNVTSNAALNIGGVAGGVAAKAGRLVASQVTLAASADINFNHTDAAYVFDTVINGSGSINHYAGRTIFNADQSVFSGVTTLYGGTLEVNGLLGGVVDINGGTLAGVGSVGNTSNNAGGTIAPGSNGIGTLTVAGNYTSNGGALNIQSALANDTSPTDLFVVTGDVIFGTGATRVFVSNLGGVGGETTGDGIKIVDVTGVSASDAFELGGPAIGGAYRYSLFQNALSDPTDGDWYLRSAGLAPTVPVYETYPVLMLGLTELPTLRQRVGDRYWVDDATSSTTDGADVPRNVWTRMEGSHNHVEGSSTTGASYDANRFLLQAGIDGLLSESDKGQLIGGINVQYGRAHANVISPIGDGENSTNSYSLGATLTWYGNDGFYVDGQAMLAKLSTDLSASEVGKLVDGNDGNGYGLSIEAGRRMALDSNWSITPQAQFSYNAVNFHSFTDPFNAQVSLDSGDTAKGRVGMVVDYQNRDGSTNSRVYSIANLTYDFLNGTSVNLSNVNTRFEPSSLGAELGFGGAYQWADGKYNVYGEALASTRFDGSNGFKGVVGFKTVF